MLTKLIHEAKSLGVHLGPKYLKIDQKSEKRYLEQIKETFQKPPKDLTKYNTFEDDPYPIVNGAGNLYDDMGLMSTHENSLRESRKPPEVTQIEEEYNALTSYDLVLRRGRCGRYFAKYVQKSIFEDSDVGSDAEDDGVSNLERNQQLRKRRKRYLDLEEYLNCDGSRSLSESKFSGLLMRD
jgi:hypothetical protein